MRRILFVGAPFGRFFRAFAEELEARGCMVWRTVFDGGDVLETPARNRVSFFAGEDEWPNFVKKILQQKNIDGIVAFNDTLPRNSKALAIAKSLGIRRYVLENGYLRPFWVTFDRDGVNGHSQLPANLDFYLEAKLAPAAHTAFPTRMRDHVLSTIRHFSAAVLLSPVIPFDPKYFGDSIWLQSRGYMREWLWRVTNDETQKVDQVAALSRDGRPIFLCLLQKPGDSQLVVHSQYGGNARFLNDVVRSFAEDAPPEAVLVIKQHPLDYGIEKCPDLLDRLTHERGLEGRVFYLRKTSIDIIMPIASALLTINSTAGLAAVAEGKPVKCLGKAFYDIPGLTFDGTLKEFWSRAEKPSDDAVKAFVAHLTSTSQFNGGFHSLAGRLHSIPNLAQALLKDSLVWYPAGASGRETASVADAVHIAEPAAALKAP
jgi:capsular polysaccharide export protein